MMTSDGNANYHSILFEPGMTPVKLNREMEKIERHKNVSRTLVYTWDRRSKNGFRSDPM